MGARAMPIPIAISDREADIDRAVRPYRDACRTIRRQVAQADEGLVTPEEALNAIAATATRALGDSR